MKFIVDSADLAQLQDSYEHLACDGVTTNPSILAKSAPSSAKTQTCTCR